VAEKADAWAGLFRARREALHGRGVRYLQMIVPEKSSLLPDLFPLPIPSPTPIMSALQARIAAAPALDAAYVDCLGALRASGRPREAFRQLDSHMRVQGNVVLFTALLRALGHHEEIAVDLARHAVFPSDLGGNFPGLPLREVLSFPRPNQFAEQEAALETLEFHRPEEPGKHLGSRCVWRNPAAPLDLRVVVFGNSFFERGAHATCLSWWGARWFREFHFLWAPEVDYAYVDRVRPDVVVGQTIERFLPVPPAA
jgi:hypothetical protein